jgi:hypothetical protein
VGFGHLSSVLCRGMKDKPQTQLHKFKEAARQLGPDDPKRFKER